MTELHGVEEHAEDSADRCVHVHKVGSRSGQRCNTPPTGDSDLCEEHRTRYADAERVEIEKDSRPHDPDPWRFRRARDEPVYLRQRDALLRGRHYLWEKDELARDDVADGELPEHICAVEMSHGRTCRRPADSCPYHSAADSAQNPETQEASD